MYFGRCWSMNCLKCGKEIDERQVFCPHCLEIMQAYPVKPGAVIHLPNREVPAAEKKAPRQKELRPDDQLIQLRKLTHGLTATIALLSLLLCLTAGMLIHTLSNTSNQPAIGKNYTTTYPKNP